MPEFNGRYLSLLHSAAEGIHETGMVDLVTLAHAAEEGFDTARFTAEAEHLADTLSI